MLNNEMLKFPPKCAVSLTFCNRGENEPGMQMIGGPPSQTVTVDMLKAAKAQWDAGNGADGVVSPDESELIDLSAGLKNVSYLEGAPMMDGAAVLVLRRFVQRLLGEDAVGKVEHELEHQMQNGKIDKQKYNKRRKVVQNKHKRWNNVMADFDQEPDIRNGKGTVVNMVHYPMIQALNNHAAMWLQQDKPVICEQNRYYNIDKSTDGTPCRIGWHGDKEREIVLGVRFGQATKKMPMMFHAFYDCAAVGPRTTIHLNPGDAYMMSSKAVGTDWDTKVTMTWRHAAGDPLVLVKELTRKAPSDIKATIAKRANTWRKSLATQKKRK